MEFPRIPGPIVFFMTVALFVGVLVLLASPFVGAWWLWHHISFK